MQIAGHHGTDAMLLLQAVAFADSVLNCGYPDTYIPPTTSTKPRFTVKSPRSASCSLCAPWGLDAERASTLVGLQW
jgi:hypothetical protein